MGSMIGINTGNVVAACVKAKKCSTCSATNIRKRTVKSHTCPTNHSGLSGSMEASMALELVAKMCNTSKARYTSRE